MFPDCLCHAEGAVDNSCDDNGKCSCNAHVEGEKCDKCFDGFAEFPNCDKCAAEHYGYPNCQGIFLFLFYDQLNIKFTKYVIKKGIFLRL